MRVRNTMVEVMAAFIPIPVQNRVSDRSHMSPTPEKRRRYSFRVNSAVPFLKNGAAFVFLTCLPKARQRAFLFAREFLSWNVGVENWHEWFLSGVAQLIHGDELARLS